jgi:hypothetical protein
LVEEFHATADSEVRALLVKAAWERRRWSHPVSARCPNGPGRTGVATSPRRAGCPRQP